MASLLKEWGNHGMDLDSNGKDFQFVVSVNSVYLDFVGVVGGGCNWLVTFDA